MNEKYVRTTATNGTCVAIAVTQCRNKDTYLAKDLDATNCRLGKTDATCGTLSTT